jgi:serine/threonine protein kinase
LEQLEQAARRLTYSFGPFLLDPAERRLILDGRDLRLSPKVFETLVLLVERHGLLVDDLMKTLWPDTFVEEVTLARNISLLRKALGDAPGQDQSLYVETVSKHGYRFIAEVKEVYQPAAQSEYLEGESLEARLRKGALPIEEALHIAIQIASALDAAHRKGVVHRDLKPGNVMLTRGGAKLLDFGLARMAQPVTFSGTDTPAPTAAQTLTAQGTILGTFQYMSPEQLEGKETDARSDIFTFGAMLFEMITGRKGFEGSSHVSLIVAVKSVNPPPVSTIQPMASSALDRLVQTCLAKSPDDRWQSAGDLSRELKWITETGSKAGIPAPVAAKRRNRERMAGLDRGPSAE